MTQCPGSNQCGIANRNAVSTGDTCGIRRIVRSNRQLRGLERLLIDRSGGCFDRGATKRRNVVFGGPDRTCTGNLAGAEADRIALRRDLTRVRANQCCRIFSVLQFPIRSRRFTGSLTRLGLGVFRRVVLEPRLIHRRRIACSSRCRRWRRSWGNRIEW